MPIRKPTLAVFILFAYLVANLLANAALAQSTDGNNSVCVKADWKVGLSEHKNIFVIIETFHSELITELRTVHIVKASSPKQVDKMTLETRVRSMAMALTRDTIVNINHPGSI